MLNVVSSEKTIYQFNHMLVESTKKRVVKDCIPESKKNKTSLTFYSTLFFLEYLRFIFLYIKDYIYFTKMSYLYLYICIFKGCVWYHCLFFLTIS